MKLFFIDDVTGEEGVEGTGPGTELQADEEDCVDEDGPISPSERGCPRTVKEDEEEIDCIDDEDEDASPVTPPPSTTSSLNPTTLRDTGPPDR